MVVMNVTNVMNVTDVRNVRNVIDDMGGGMGVRVTDVRVRGGDVTVWCALLNPYLLRTREW